MDQHVHFTGGGGECGFRSRVPELSLTDFTTAGVTTAVGLLGTDSATRSPKALLAKTKALNEEGLTAYCLTGAYDIPSPTVTGSLKDDVTTSQRFWASRWHCRTTGAATPRLSSSSIWPVRCG